MMIRCSLVGLLLSGCASAPWAPPMPPEPASVPAPVPVQRANLSDWMEYVIPGKRSTRYTPLVLDGRPVVHAASDSAASVFRRRVRVEPAELGTLRFSWRVEELIKAADLNEADSADSPVRLILAFDGDHKRLSLRNRLSFDLAHAISGETPPFATLMYVWDNKAPLESVIHSGRTDRVRKIVLESGAARLGRWCHYERDIIADYRKTFGEEPGPLVSVALMTDADNTRSTAEAWYGEVLLEGPDGRPR
jgi:Protein of unknown function (DUF3047)